jgi:hypothetical protein
VTLADETDFLNLQAQMRVASAEVLQAAHRDEQARQAAEAAIDLYERKGNRVGADRAAELARGVSAKPS